MTLAETAPTAVGLDETATRGLFALAARLYFHEMYAQSARVLEFLLRHEPARPHYHRALGKAWHALGEHDKAVHAYARAVKLGLPDADVHFYIGQCLVYLRRYELAEQALQSCLLIAKVQHQRGNALADRADHMLTRVQALRRKAVSVKLPTQAIQQE